MERERISLSIAEVAELMPLSRSSLYKLAERKEAPFHKKGGKWMATPEDLKAWIREDRPQPKEDLLSKVADYERTQS